MSDESTKDESTKEEGLSFEVYMPPGTAKTYRKLLELHPEFNTDEVLAMALAFYHSCLELHLEGKASPDVSIPLVFLRELALLRKSRKEKNK